MGGEAMDPVEQHVGLGVDVWCKGSFVGEFSKDQEADPANE